MVVGFSGAHQIQWLAQKHPWNANQCNRNEHGLNFTLTFEHELITSGQCDIRFEQHHVDEHIQNGWSAAW